ncbi:PREDICTED: poly(A)-specific ribonuclease PARN-like isoform X1 [Trachymyrmex septentrionalis]|uniref:poly(A)-specific ribonuclease PARN-like isoform X1 n=2 Tax=Trachymyrmex septentrionalis TaxID=34720 RepID=UPI00084F39AD|nr:PREDICTED: poly(A)-specific ribonuclease PARN-like isoform X1 [Trachymyrmex septentrionalis]
MEVTSSNFQDVLSELDSVIKDATFLSIDGEFTGLFVGPDGGQFDTPAQYYSKIRAGSMNFLMMQFGLSVFTYNSDTQKYSQRSYNFYVFPKPINRQITDTRFMCQSSSLIFLANKDFDFNKLFKHGIPYLTASDEEKLIKRLEEKRKVKEENYIIPITDNDKPQIEEICSRIENFLASDAKELTIDHCNSFMRRLVYQEARIRWPNKVIIENKMEDGWQCLLVRRVGTNEEEEEMENQKREKEQLEIKQAVGLSNLLKKIVESEKIIVGHNMLLDLCHIVHQFFTSLPKDYSEFKTLLHGLFPKLLDTKVICQSQHFKELVGSSNLNLLIDIVSKPPFCIPDIENVEGCSYSMSREKYHEAGYDAYITGLCFIALSNYLGKLQHTENAMVLANSPLLYPFLNKIPVPRLKDFPYINLVGKDPNPSREHVFHLTFPKEWKHTDIIQLFIPFGGGYISWLSDTSAYVGLYRRDQAGVAMTSLSKETAYKIQTYTEYQATLLQANASPEDRKRKLSPSKKDMKDDETSTTNGVKPSEDDDDEWQVATGKRRKKRKEQTTTVVASKKAFEENDAWN